MNFIDLLSGGCSNVSITVALTDLMKMVEYMLTLRSEQVDAKTEQNDDEFMTRKEVMSYLGIKETTIHNWAIRGLLKPHKVGHKTYFKKSDVIALQRGAC